MSPNYSLVDAARGVINLHDTIVRMGKVQAASPNRAIGRVMYYLTRAAQELTSTDVLPSLQADNTAGLQEVIDPLITIANGEVTP